MNKTTAAQQNQTASFLPPAQDLLQRKCASCGNLTVAGGECMECAKKKTGLQRKLTIGASNDPLELEADRVADQVLAAPANSAVNSAPLRIQRYAGQATEGSDYAPASVDRVLSGSGRPMEPTLRQDMEQRFGHDFSGVRVHSGGAAEQSARDVNAHAYTVGHNIVFGAGQFAPGTHGGRRLLAHELVHTVQQTSSLSRSIQRKEGDIAVSPSNPAVAAAAMPPRQNVCYFMGDVTKDAFFISAFRFFHSRFPNAVFVSNIKNLTDLLDHINTHFSQPLANIFIITHANEDGTVSFGLDKNDKDKHTEVRELKKALHTTGGSSSLPSVGKQIDANTKIQIKGCDLGRTQEMLELIDEVFGGQGQVTAPTHEQGYYFDEKTTADSAKRILQEHMTQFDGTLTPIPPLPDPVDKNLKGDAKKDAVKARQAAIQARDAVIAQRKKDTDAERKKFQPEAHRLGEIEGSGEFLSGPMFQRQGDQLFTEAEILVKVNILYAHLSVKQRASLAKILIAPDKRPNGNIQGTYQQKGQRAYKIVPFTQSYFDPKNLQDAIFLFGKQFKKGFIPTSMSTAVGASDITITMQGKLGKQDYTMTFTIGMPPNDSELIKLGKEQVNNPDKFVWSVETTNVHGKAVKKVIGKRVIAYLHHGSLDVDSKHRFTASESNPDFFSKSTFSPPPTTPKTP